MTDSIAGLPFWELTFDADGDADPEQRGTLLAEVPARGVTDLIVFSHGWNNDHAMARRLYDAFFGILADQLSGADTARPVTLGLVGVLWPSQRWSDEPVPDFTAAAAAAAVSAGDGAAAVPVPAASGDVASPVMDDDTLADLRICFPAAAPALDAMADILTGPPTDAAQREFAERLRDFALLAGPGEDDGEIDDPGSTRQPRMLDDKDPAALFDRYRTALQSTGVDLSAGGGEAGIGDLAHGIWNGAKEALRATTYWAMKNRAGTVGRAGLGPLLGELGQPHRDAAGPRIHLVGHSFGARLVSYALAGLPDGLAPSPVKSVTLLQGAFSHFAFARPLPFDAGRRGALAGMQARVDGPVTVCFSSHDSAVGTFYPLSSIAAGDDAAAAQDLLFRWGGMGADGAQGVAARLVGIQAAGPEATYGFAPGAVLNVDASDVVRAGGPPSGAHSDIVHRELTWIVLSAAGIV